MKAKSRKLRPRRTPRQDRAQATVDAIVQAATYILARDEWAKLTTNRIAERAGVNIASLYQYFPSKEAILVEIQRRHGREVRRRVQGSLPAAPRSLRSVLRGTIEAAVREHRAAPLLHRALGDELPRSAWRDGEGGGARDMAGAWHAAASPHFQHVPDLELAEFITRTAIHAVVHEAAAERPELLEHPLLVDELVELVTRYLRRPKRRGAKSP